MPPCCLGLSQGHSGFKGDGKAPNSAESHSLHPSPNPPLTPEEAPPSSMRALLLQLKTKPPEASGNLPRGNQTNPHSAIQVDGFQPQATASPSPVREKKKKSVQHAISLQISSHPHRAYLDGLWGRPLLITIRSSREGRSPSHTLGSHPELNVKLYKASLKQSQGQVRTHEVHPLKVDKPVPQSLPTKVPRGG